MTSTTTCNCDDGRHHDCDGYIAPLVYSDTRPCSCACHAGIFGRDFQRALPVGLQVREDV